jgi:hypothetical protein
MKIGEVPNDHFFGFARCDDHGPIGGDINLIDLIDLGEMRLFAPRKNFYA